MSEHERIEAFLKEVTAVSEKYNMWFTSSIMYRGVCIFDNTKLRTVASEVEADGDGYFCKENDFV